MSGFDYIPRAEDGAAWVTGASAGLGRALALKLARDGWRVYVTARSEAALAALAAEHDGISPAPGDVTDAEAMRDIVGQIRRRERLALAVLNAGLRRQMRAQSYDVEAAAEIASTNLIGVSNCIGPAMDAMLAQERRNGGRGCIAVIGALSGYRGMPRSAAFSASKAGVIALAESLALDLNPRDVRLSLVSPGEIATESAIANNLSPNRATPVDEAVNRIVKGLGKPGFEIAFPAKNSIFIRGLGVLGPRSRNWLLRKVAGLDRLVD